MTRFLVTGATGFIGTAVVRHLLATGHDAVSLSRTDVDLLSAPTSELESIIGRVGAGHCIHTAWYTNHQDYLVHSSNEQWVDATLRLADVFVATGGKRFVGLGTCLEYDVGTADGPLSETSRLAPNTLYAQCKLSVEQALAERRLDAAWARVFFVYGPGDRRGRLIPEMLARFRAGTPSGPKCGALRRDYIHVDDLAAQLVRIATSAIRGVINTGTGQAPTLSEIYRSGAEALGRPELARANEEDCGQPLLIQADMRRFRQEIGEPGARDIVQGLRDLVG